MDKLKVVYSNNKRAWCFCPKHKDIHTPNLSITLTDDYYGYAKCWACGWEYIFSSEQIKELNLSKEKRKKPVPIDWVALTNTYCRDLTEVYLLFKDVLPRQWNVHTRVLNRFRIGFDGSAYTFPMKIDNKIVGIQRRFSDGSKCCVDGSRLGLFVSTILNYETELFICEGLSDAVVIQDIFGWCDVIGRPNCNYGKEIVRDWIDNEWTDIYYDPQEDWGDDRQIIIIPDNDKAGQKGALDLYAEITTNIDINCKIFKFGKAKDIREYISKFGEEVVRHELEELIDE